MMELACAADKKRHELGHTLIRQALSLTQSGFGCAPTNPGARLVSLGALIVDVDDW